MKYRKSAALAMALLMVLVSSAMVVRASEEPPVPIPFTPTDSAPEFAVYFADNMAFTPQWRIGNLVRIETMVLKVMDGTVPATDADGLPTTALSTPVVVNADMTTGVVYDQADLMADPSLILNTWMVSVSYIAVTIEVGTEYSKTFVADFAVEGDESELGREINKAGHLIYGMLWDTTGVPAGIPKVTVSVPGYSVMYAARSLVLAEDADPVAYELLPIGDPAVAVIGTGGLVGANAYLYIGVLMAKGGSSGGGGNGNGGGGHRGK
ncbi:MAG: hypothetical protein MUC90_05610 [Thermoplasmata archaeon]|jgi:hypothetical protein|nr:hypothetical protein [Thermoplasmata archaeon]